MHEPHDRPHLYPRDQPVPAGSRRRVFYYDSCLLRVRVAHVHITDGTVVALSVLKGLVSTLPLQLVSVPSMQ